MRNIELYISKADVFEEVAKTTAYTGAKQATDESGFDKVFLSDAETEMLDRYWNEVCTDISLRLSEWIVEVEPSSASITLAVADGFNDALTDSLTQAITSYFVTTLLYKWYSIAMPTLAEGMVAESISHIKRVTELVNQRKRPTR